MSIKVKVERGSGLYYGTTQNIPGVVVADGSNLNELKENLREAVGLYLETAEEHDPETFEKLKQGFEIEYQYNIPKIFEALEVINKSEFSKRIGVNPALFRSYTSKKDVYISEKRVQEIEKGLHELGKELLSIKI